MFFVVVVVVVFVFVSVMFAFSHLFLFFKVIFLIKWYVVIFNILCFFSVGW